MAQLVKEIMNPELFSVRSTDSAEDALNGILAFGITGAPVVGGDGRPLGMVSLRDLVGRREGDTAADRMNAPAAVVAAEAPIADAGRLLAETGYHRLVVVDSDGRAVGIVSALDVVRGLLGLPAVHPATFPHLDRETGLVWSDDLPLEPAALESAPEGPGLLVLAHGEAASPERIVWAEASDALRARLEELLTQPQSENHLLAFWLARGHLRFRTAAVTDPAKRREGLESLRRHGNLPILESWI